MFTAGFYTVLSSSFLKELTGKQNEKFSFAGFAAQLQSDHPLQFATEDEGGYPQITGGILALTEPGEEFMAVLVVAESVEDAKRIVKVELEPEAAWAKVDPDPAPDLVAVEPPVAQGCAGWVGALAEAVQWSGVLSCWIGAPPPPAQPKTEVELAQAAATGPSSGTKGDRMFVWFSDRLKQATDNALVLTFTPAVLEAISLELVKVRAGRAEAMQRVYPSAIQTRLDSAQWQELRQEQVHAFDIAKSSLLETFMAVLDLASKDDLGEGADTVALNGLHTLFHADQGTKRDRRQKIEMLSGLRDASEARQAFIEAYEKLILEQV